MGLCCERKGSWVKSKCIYHIWLIIEVALHPWNVILHKILNEGRRLWKNNDACWTKLLRKTLVHFNCCLQLLFELIILQLELIFFFCRIQVISAWSCIFNYIMVPINFTIVYATMCCACGTHWIRIIHQLLSTMFKRIH